MMALWRSITQIWAIWKAITYYYWRPNANSPYNLQCTGKKGANKNGEWKHRDTCVDFKLPNWLPFFSLFRRVNANTLNNQSHVNVHHSRKSHFSIAILPSNTITTLPSKHIGSACTLWWARREMSNINGVWFSKPS